MFSPCRKLRWAVVLTFCASLLLAACGGDERPNQPSSDNQTALRTTTDLHAGGAPPTPEVTQASADTIAAGEKLYSADNCNGCHSAGGGGMGPPLMDEEWIYGGRPEQIVATLIQGQPNGMPSFRGKIPEAEMWQLAAYVRSLGEQASKVE